VHCRCITTVNQPNKVSSLEVSPLGKDDLIVPVVNISTSPHL